MKVIDAGRTAFAWLKANPKSRSYLIGAAAVIVVIVLVRMVA